MKKTFSPIYILSGVIFTTCLIISNITAQKTITILGLSTTADIIVFPIAYIINDLIAEVWGFKKASLIIWTGFLVNFFMVIIFQLSIWIPANELYPHSEAFAQVLGSTLRITAASFIAFLIGSFMNAYIMSRMKIMQKGKGFSIRAIVSTLAGESIDSLFFFTIAFAGLMPYYSVVILTLHNAFIKTAYEILVLPLSNFLVKRIKDIEGTDVYDVNISYNPFKLKD